MTEYLTDVVSPQQTNIKINQTKLVIGLSTMQYVIIQTISTVESFYTVVLTNLYVRCTCPRF